MAARKKVVRRRPASSPTAPRSAKTGKYVTKRYAKQHPATTVNETKRRSK